MSEQFKISEEMLDRLSNLKALINKYYGHSAEYLAVLSFARKYVLEHGIPLDPEDVIEAYLTQKAVKTTLRLRPEDVESGEVGDDALLSAPIFLNEEFAHLRGING